jgi:hypothetical protein
MECIAEIKEEEKSNLEIEETQIEPGRIVNRELIRLERFLCVICKNLLIDMKKCSLCFSHFCTKCIDFYKNKSMSNYCPACHTIDYKIEEGESYLKKFINDLIIKCKNASKGCNELCYYQNIFEHEKICKYREKSCENCQQLLNYEEYFKHIVDCFKISESAENSIKQQRILNLIKAFDDKISKIKYENKYGINFLRIEMTKALAKLDEKIRTIEKFTTEQDFIIRTAGLEKYKFLTPNNILGKNFKECQVYFFCKGGYNGCNRTGNVWGSNPYTSDSVICLAALHSGHITKEGGLFIVKKGGPLDAYVGSVKNGVSTQSYGSFDHMIILPSELDVKISMNNNQCGPKIGICKGKANGCCEKGDIWGDNPYVKESNLCKAALHSGFISEHGGIFMIEESGTHGGYIGSTKNSVMSLPCSSNRASISIKPFLPY